MTMVIGKRKIDLEFDPPPDIVVEIDTMNESPEFSVPPRLTMATRVDRRARPDRLAA